MRTVLLIRQDFFMEQTSLVGKRLKEERKRLGMGQDQVAMSVHVTREMWGRYERGVSVPGLDVVMSASAVGMDVYYVLTGERAGGPVDVLTKKARLLLDVYTSLDDEGQQAIDGVVRVIAKAEARYPDGHVNDDVPERSKPTKQGAGATLHFNGPVSQAVGGNLNAQTNVLHVAEKTAALPQRRPRK
jgi:transcriptional regulator with XRE-family HTH domain